MIIAHQHEPEWEVTAAQLFHSLFPTAYSLLHRDVDHGDAKIPLFCLQFTHSNQHGRFFICM